MKEVNEIMEELRDMNSPLADMSRTMPYSVPAGYFDQLPGDVLDAINYNVIFSEQERYGTPFDVPAGYFDALPMRLLMAAKEQDAKVEEIPEVPARRIALFVPVKWAAAAVMALVITLGSYVMFTGSHASGPEKMLSSVPGKDINEYLQRSYSIDAAHVIPAKAVKDLKVDNKEIVAYLDETGWD